MKVNPCTCTWTIDRDDLLFFSRWCSSRGIYGVGNESSAISNVTCQGTENNITECMYTNITAPDNCIDVGLYCRGKQRSVTTAKLGCSW